MNERVKTAHPYHSKFFQFLRSLDELNLTPFLTQGDDGLFRPNEKATALLGKRGTVQRDSLAGIAEIALRIGGVDPPLLVARYVPDRDSRHLRMVGDSVAKHIDWIAIPEGSATRWLAALVTTERSPEHLMLAGLTIMSLSTDRPHWFDGKAFLRELRKRLIGTPGFYDRIVDLHIVH